MKAFKITGIFRLQNQLELVNVKTGAVFYYKPTANISVQCYRVGQVIAL